MGLINVIVDLSHHNSVVSFHEVADAGVVGVIHKATQGAGFVDKEYHQRRTRARSVNLLWGAYHFASKGNPEAQANHFLQEVAPDSEHANGLLLVLDWEPNKIDGAMTRAEAETFVKVIKAATGRVPVLYSGQAFLKEKVGNSHTSLSECPLWVARYSSQLPQIPPAWSTFTFWQYTDGNVGPQPHTVPGIGSCDRNKFNGDLTGLKKLWGV